MAEASDGITDGINGSDTGIESDGIAVVDPAAIGAETGAGADAPKRRGRKPGSRNSTGTGTGKKSQAALDINGVEKVLFSMHMMLASAVKAPELAISTEEAKMLSTAVGEVSKHYNFGIDEKTQAWVNLVMVAGGIYVPRIIMMVKPKKKPQSTETNVSEGTLSWNNVAHFGGPVNG